VPDDDHLLNCPWFPTDPLTLVPMPRNWTRQGGVAYALRGCAPRRRSDWQARRVVRSNLARRLYRGRLTICRGTGDPYHIVTMGRSGMVTSPGGAAITRGIALTTMATVAMSPLVPLSFISRLGLP
jgi:hypothetical protein